MISRIASILVFVFGSCGLLAQMLPEKGMPQLRNYAPTLYKNKGKIWDIGSAPNGIVYFAADKGLLEYDGKTWNCYKGSDGITRSVLVVNDSLIYTGSDMDFGVWKRNRNGSFYYKSLYPFKQDLQDKNEEFWDVHLFNGDVLFVSSQNIYIIKKQQVIRINAPSQITGSFCVNETLYLSVGTDGLYIFNNVSLKRLFKYPENANYEVAGIYHYDGIVLVTRNSGLLRYSSGELLPMINPVCERIKTAKVFSFTQIGISYLAFGTVTKGLFITDLEGNILHHINRYKGLISNTILCIHYSLYGRLWMGMDFGISSLVMNNDITYFYDYRGDYGTGYVADIFDETFYLGTNQGLYYAKWEDLNNGKEFTDFQLIPETEGQVWAIKNIGDALLIGHDKGLFSINDRAVEKLSDHAGVWTIVPYGDYMLTGNYNGIEIFKLSGGQWKFRNKMDLILGSCNQLVVEKENVLWVNIPNYGIIRVLLDENADPVNRIIFPSNHFKGNNPFLLINHNIINIITDKYQYAYNEGNGKFSQVKKTLSPHIVDNLLVNIYQPASLHPDYDFFPIYNGFALKFLQYDKKNFAKTPGILLRKAEAFNTHEVVSICPGDKLPYNLNNLRIEFIVPNHYGMEYQYKVNQYDRWSPASNDNILELINLRQGSYAIQLRVLMNGKIVSQRSISFQITAPWYISGFAIAFYSLLLIVALIGIRRWHLLLLKKQRKNLLIKEQKSLRKQAEKHREKIMLMHQERLQAENDQLEQQLKNKTIELAKQSKDSEDKNRLLIALKEKFDSLQNDSTISKIRLREISRLLDSCLKADDRTFQIQMDELHQDLFRKLKENYPSLSNNDLRLCAYLKVGLNSKEIAEILNIQPSSSYISRSRLRKKLNLKPDEDLYDFLTAI